MASQSLTHRIFRLLLLISFVSLSFVTGAGAALTDNGNGTVSDDQSGLIWQQVPAGPMTWLQALVYSEALNLANCNTWRMPNQKELKTLTLKTKTSPAIDTEAFPGFPPELFWTSTPVGNKGDIWGIDFATGSGSKVATDNLYYVMAVTSGCELDATPPSLHSTSPEAGSIDLTIDGHITATFSEALDPATVDAVSFSLNNGVTGTITVDGSTATFDPDGFLSYNTLYTATISTAVKDLAGNALATPVSWSFSTPDIEAPSGTVQINGDAAATNNDYVTLTLSASDDSGSVAAMRVTNDPDIWLETWVPYTTSIDWSLPTGDGNKTVYVQLKDTSGNVATASDSITLDTVAAITIDSVASPTNHPEQTISGTRSPGDTVTVTTSTDAVVGSVSYPTVSTWQSTITNLQNGTNSITATVSDLAGNSAAAVTTIELDTIAPTGSLVINEGTTAINSTLTSLDITSGGAAQMRLSNDNATWGEWIAPPVTTMSWNLTVGPDGPRTVYIQFEDEASNRATFSDTISLDTSTSVFIDAIETPSNQTSKTISGTCEAGATVKVALDSGDDQIAEKDETSWSYSFTGLSEGNHTVKVSATDTLGNGSEPISSSFMIDLTPPDNGSVTINGGNDLTNSSNVSLTIASSDAAKMQLSNDESIWTPWESYSTERNWSLSAGEGPHTVYVRFMDEVGNISTSTYDSISVDTTPPLVSSVEIDSDIEKTRSLDVTVAIVASEAFDMRLSADHISWSTWEAFTSSKPFTLPVNDGLKTVYVQLRDNAGNIVTASDDITLDTQATVTFDPVTTPTNLPAQTLTGTREPGAEVVITVDTVAKIGQVNLEAEADTWSCNITDLQNGNNTFTATATDDLGNVKNVSATITLDGALPTGAVIIKDQSSGNQDITNDTTVTLALTAEGSGSSVTHLRVANSAEDLDSAPWLNYTETMTWSLYPGQDSNRWVYVQVKDAAGNISDVFSDEIELDTTTPAISIFEVATPTNLTSQDISGTCESDAIVSINVGDTTSPDTTCGTDGTWGPITISGFVEGLNTILATATDSAGNQGEASAEIVFDTSTEVTLEVDSPTKEISQRVFGTCETDATISIMVGATTPVSTTCTDGAWSYDLTQLQIGDNNISVIATDLATNMASIADIITVDQTVPVGSLIIIRDLDSGSELLTNSTSVKLQLAATDNLGVIAGMRLAGTFDGLNVADYEDYATEKIWTLANDEEVQPVFVQFQDMAGNESTPISSSIKLDTLAPDVTIDSVTSPTSADSQNIHGSCEEGASVKVSLNGTTGQAATVNGTSWEFTVDGLIPGDNNIIVTAMDDAGNMGTADAQIARDTVSTITINPVTTLTNSDSQTISGTCEEDATIDITVTNNDKTINTVSLTAEGTTWSSPIFLAEGINIISAVATDTLENVSTPATTTITKDTVPPVGSLAINSGEALTNNSTVILNITATDDKSAVTHMQFKEENGTWSDWEAISGSKPFTLVGDDGHRAVYAKFHDAAGNISTKYSATIWLDTDAPAITINSVVSPTNQDSQLIVGSCEDGADVVITLNGGNQQLSAVDGERWTFEITGLAEGSNTVRATANDTVGNQTTVTADIILDINTKVTINPVASPTSQTTKVLSGSCEEGSSVVVTVNGMEQGNVAVDGTTWNCAVDLLEGNNSIVATATDTNNNSDSANLNVDLDITPPADVPLFAKNTFEGGTVDLDWGSYPAPADLSHYQLFVSTTDYSDISTMEDHLELPADTTTFSLTGMENNISYYLAIVGVDSLGNRDVNVTTIQAIPTLQGIQGFITDSSTGTSLAGAEVLIDDLGSTTVTTNSNGFFRKNGLPSGNYNLTISGTGYLTDTASVLVPESEMTEISVALAAVPTPLPAPQNVSAESGDSQVTVSWDAISDLNLAGYNLYRMISEFDANPVLLNDNRIPGTFYVDMDLTNGTTYWYKVESVTKEGLVNVSAPTSATPVLSAPLPVSDLRATLNENDTVTLNWSESPTPGVTAYNIYSDNGDGIIDYSVVNQTVNASTTSWTSEILNAGETRYFAVRVEKSGMEEANTSAMVSVTVPAEIVEVPSTAVTHPRTARRIQGNRITVRADLVKGQAAEVESVAFQYRKIGTLEWQDIQPATVNLTNPDKVAPYTIHWDVLPLENGFYELRSIATAKANGMSDISAQTQVVQVDHNNPNHQEWKNDAVVHQTIETVERNVATNLEMVASGSENTYGVNLPAGVLDTNTELLAEIPEPEEMAAKVIGVKSINRFLRLKLSSGQTQFPTGKEVEIRIPYLDGDRDGVVDGTTIPVDTLRIKWYNPDTGSWEETGISDQRIDTDARLLIAKTSHFSEFSGMGDSTVAVAINAIPSPSSSNTITITGTRSADDPVTVTAEPSASVEATQDVTWGSTTWSYTISALAEGSTTFTATADDGGGVQATDTATIVVDTIPPTNGLVTINDGDATTDSTSVVLTLAATDATTGTSQMVLRNSDSNWGAWEPYSTTRNWTFSEGDGEKTVFVQFADEAGNTSAIYSDTISYASTGDTGTVPTSNSKPSGVPVMNGWWLLLSVLCAVGLIGRKSKQN